MRIRIDLPGLPRGKGRGRAVSTPNGARVYTDAKTRSYEAQLKTFAVQAMRGRLPTALPVRLVMTAFLPVPESWSKRKRAEALAGIIWPLTKPDVDNYLKCCDALNAIVWNDDKQIVNACVMKVYAERPGLTIEITELGASASHGVAKTALAGATEPYLALE